MMWRNHQLDLTPKDLDGYLRVMHTAHELGLKTLVYASPHFYLKNSELEDRAHPDPITSPA